MRSLVFATVIGLVAAGPALAGGECCAPASCDPVMYGDPGCDPGYCNGCGCRKVCKVVCEMKKVKKTVWVVECEDFCAPLPRLGCHHGCSPCAANCGACKACKDCCDPCASLQRPIVPPKCGKVRTKKTLVKKEIECEVPVYKCVVVCPTAHGDCGQGWCEAPEGQAAPAPVGQTTLSAPLPPVIGTSYVE